MTIRLSHIVVLGIIVVIIYMVWKRKGAGA